MADSAAKNPNTPTADEEKALRSKITTATNAMLRMAALNGNLEECRRLIVEEQADVNTSEPSAGAAKGETPLHSACVSGRVDIAELLLEHGADVDQKSSDGWVGRTR